MEKLVIYRETKPLLGDLRPTILDQAQYLLQLRLKMLGKEPENQKYLSPIREFISGFDDSCGSAVTGIVYDAEDSEDIQLFKGWIFKNLFDRELYLLPGTWDIKYRGETSLNGFEQDFRLHKRIPSGSEPVDQTCSREELTKTAQKFLDDANPYFIDPGSASSVPFYESFVLVIAKGYTSDFKKPEELFNIIEAGSEKLPPPFETEMIVANGKGIAGDILIFYFENTFNGVPRNLGNFDFPNEFEQNWLNKIVPVKSPDYILEYYGPRNYQIEKYWPGINILMKKRLPACSPDMTIQPTVDEQAARQGEYKSADAPGKKDDESSNKELSVKPVEEILGYPLAFKLNSLEVKQTYQYSEGTSKKELTSSSNYRFLVASITIQNKTKHFMRFSSAQFSFLNKSGEKINAKFYGVGNSVAERGTTLSLESKVTGPDEKPIVTYWGKINENVSFIEWILSPGKSHDDNLIYLIPATESELDIQFTNSFEPLEQTGVSPLKITFSSQEIRQSYKYTSGSSQIETTASSEYSFLVTRVTMTNNTEIPIRFSSGNFSVMDNSGKKVGATFFGAENQIAKDGKITSFETNIDNPDNKQKAKISGTLSTSVSFIEWELGPHYSREESLVYLIPSNAGNVKLHFDFCLGDGTHYKSASSGNSGCFIATAAFSKTSPEVIILRAYRDNILNQSPAGRAVITLYYRISPPLAKWISKSDSRRKSARILLKPFLKMSEKALDRIR